MGCVNLSTSSSLIVDADALNELKEKIICEYQDLIKMLEKGYKLDYEFILEEISYIEINDTINKDKSLFLLQFYLNNKWQTLS